MARPLKEGLDYYPRKVGIYDDPKVIELVIDCGWIGFVIWDYLLDKIYQNGYFYPWNERSPKNIAFKMSGGIVEGQVREVVEACCKCGLFDGTVLTACGILTSRGIQQRYCIAAAERRNKEVIAEYWLLDDSKSAGFVKRTLNKVILPDNPDKSPNNPSKSPNNAIEESKAKESKAKESKNANGGDAPHKRGEYGWVYLTDAEYNRLIAEFGNETVAHYITYVDESAQQTGNKNKWKDWNLTVRKAIKNKWGVPANITGPSRPRKESSFDMEEIDRLINKGVF